MLRASQRYLRLETNISQGHPSYQQISLVLIKKKRCISIWICPSDVIHLILSVFLESIVSTALESKMQKLSPLDLASICRNCIRNHYFTFSAASCQQSVIWSFLQLFGQSNTPTTTSSPNNHEGMTDRFPFQYAAAANTSNDSNGQ